MLASYCTLHKTNTWFEWNRLNPAAKTWGSHGGANFSYAMPNSLVCSYLHFGGMLVPTYKPCGNNSQNFQRLQTSGMWSQTVWYAVIYILEGRWYPVTNQSGNKGQKTEIFLFRQDWDGELQMCSSKCCIYDWCNIQQQYDNTRSQTTQFTFLPSLTLIQEPEWGTFCTSSHRYRYFHF